MEWAQKEEERLEALQPDRIPDGMMEIPEADRLKTLADLKKSICLLLCLMG
jgi:hypothetical protein